MTRENRKHPRVPIEERCSLRSTETAGQEEARTFCVATHGLGLRLRAPEAVYTRGDRVSVALIIDDEPTEIPGTVAWVERRSEQEQNLGIEFFSDSPYVIGPYLSWVHSRYEELRKQSMALGSDLAIHRKITLRAFQRALDQQACDGGTLQDHLQELTEG